MSNIDVPRVVRDMADTVGDLITAAEDACGQDTAAQLAKVETIAARIYATAVQSRAQLTSGLAAALAILHYGHLVPSLQEPTPATPPPPAEDATRKRARARRRATTGAQAPRKRRGSPKAHAR